MEAAASTTNENSGSNNRKRARSELAEEKDILYVHPLYTYVNGRHMWKKHGNVHRDFDLPAQINDSGTLIWCIDGKIHREGDLPAAVKADGSQYWYKYGNLHRDGDLPADIDADSTKRWYQNGNLHREGDQPAVIEADGNQGWYKNGALHRDHDKPAIEGADGGKEWYKNGVMHRDNDLPAVLFANGIKEWWIDGAFIRRTMPDQVLEEHGPAHQVHKKFEAIDLEKLYEIVAPGQWSAALNRIPEEEPTHSEKKAVWDRLKLMTQLELFTAAEKLENRHLLQSIFHKYKEIEFRKRPTMAEIRAILNYVRRQPYLFQKNYITSFIEQSVFAYDLREGQPPIDRRSSAPNNSTSSCPAGIRERLLFALRDGGLNLPDNPEYQQIAAIIAGEHLTRPMLLHAASTCFSEHDEQWTQDGKTTAEKKALLMDCMMRWIRENHDYRSDTVPPLLQDIVEETASMLEPDINEIQLNEMEVDGGGKIRTRRCDKKKKKKRQSMKKKRLRK